MYEYTFVHEAGTCSGTTWNKRYIFGNMLRIWGIERYRSGDRKHLSFWSEWGEDAWYLAHTWSRCKMAWAALMMPSWWSVVWCSPVWACNHTDIHPRSHGGHDPTAFITHWPEYLTWSPWSSLCSNTTFSLVVNSNKSIRNVKLLMNGTLGILCWMLLRFYRHFEWLD